MPFPEGYLEDLEDLERVIASEVCGLDNVYRVTSVFAEMIFKARGRHIRIQQSNDIKTVNIGWGGIDRYCCPLTQVVWIEKLKQQDTSFTDLWSHPNPSPAVQRVLLVAALKAI